MSNFLFLAETISADKAIQISMLVIYILMMVTIAFICRKKSSTLDDFFLGGRGLGGWMSAFSYGTTYFSSVIFIGYAGKFGWNMGIASIFIGIGNALIGTLLAWKILANPTRLMTRRLGAVTMPDFFAKRYDSPKMKMVASIIIFVFLIPYSASVYQGLGYLFEMVFGIDVLWCVIIMAVLTALYLFFGGYFATSLSDFVQGMIMLVGVVLMVCFTLNHPNVNWAEGFEKLTEMGFGFNISTEGGWDSPVFNLVILILLTSFGIWGLPQSVHKFYAVKDKKAINKAMVVSTVFSLLVGGGAYFVGSMSHLFFGNTLPQGGYDTVIPIMLQQALPAALLGLIVVLVLSASMSTLASLSLASGSAIAVDLYKGYVKPNATDKQVNVRLKILCVLFILVSVILAVTNSQAIVDFMSLSWGTLAGCFIGPYVLGLYSKKVNKYGAWTSLIMGLVTTFVLVFVFGAISPNPNYDGFLAIVKGGISRSPLIGVICMAQSVIVTYLVSLFTKKTDKKLLDKCSNDSEQEIENEVVQTSESDCKENASIDGEIIEEASKTVINESDRVQDGVNVDCLLATESVETDETCYIDNH
ncbi:MAG: sodium:solute symporter family protein [Clostridia bacterium]|nr:sodium:solute symporter family protein [Clostridia bacterium]MDY5263641.1 sodium:solute symporter family protein [Eubacteriales bacterium]